MPTIVPKPFFDESSDSYMIEVLTCMNRKTMGGTANRFIQLLTWIMIIIIMVCIELDDYKVSVSLSVPKSPFESTTKWVNFLIMERSYFLY